MCKLHIVQDVDEIHKISDCYQVISTAYEGMFIRTCIRYTDMY